MSMRFLDRVLQHWRARMARSWIPQGARVLDVGCHQGEFLDSLGDWIGPSVGLDPLTAPRRAARYQLVPELLREPAPWPEASFDVVVLLATLEHIPNKDPVARECFRLLRPGGRVLLTVPSPWVDPIMAVLCRLRLAKGMSLEEHHGFDPCTTPSIFVPSGFALERWQRFQLGLNHLFVFRKPLAAGSPAERACQNLHV
jgi:SAM-dependent methyltransferase